jgi:hypothetical protein
MLFSESKNLSINANAVIAAGSAISIMGGQLALTDAAQANIVHFDATHAFDVQIADVLQNGSISWDIDGNGAPDILFGPAYGGIPMVGFHQTANYGGAFFGQFQYLRSDLIYTSARYGFVRPLGTIVTTAGARNQWQLEDGIPGYIGFVFDPTDLRDGRNYLNGWAQVVVDINFDATTTLTVRQWAYEDTGQGIHVSDVPLPAGGPLALLGLGAAGVLAWRRRKAESSNAGPD